MIFGYAPYYRAMNTRAKFKFSFLRALSDTTNCKYKWGICYVFIRTSLFISMCRINCCCTSHVFWLTLYIVDTILRTLNIDDQMDDNVDRLHVSSQCKHVIITIRRIIITLVVVDLQILNCFLLCEPACTKADLFCDRLKVFQFDFPPIKDKGGSSERSEVSSGLHCSA